MWPGNGGAIAPYSPMAASMGLPAMDPLQQSGGYCEPLSLPSIPTPLSLLPPSLHSYTSVLTPSFPPFPPLSLLPPSLHSYTSVLTPSFTPFLHLCPYSLLPSIPTSVLTPSFPPFPPLPLLPPSLHSHLCPYSFPPFLHLCPYSLLPSIPTPLSLLPPSLHSYTSVLIPTPVSCPLSLQSVGSPRCQLLCPSQRPPGPPLCSLACLSYPVSLLCVCVCVLCLCVVCVCGLVWLCQQPSPV